MRVGRRELRKIKGAIKRRKEPMGFYKGLPLEYTCLPALETLFLLTTCFLIFDFGFSKYLFSPLVTHVDPCVFSSLLAFGESSDTPLWPHTPPTCNSKNLGCIWGRRH